jgi:hypothetical protein
MVISMKARLENYKDWGYGDINESDDVLMLMIIFQSKYDHR